MKNVSPGRSAVAHSKPAFRRRDDSDVFSRREVSTMDPDGRLMSGL